MKKLTGLFASLALTGVAVFGLASCGDKTPYNAQDMANAIVFEQEEKNVTFQTKLNDTVERYIDDNNEKVQTAKITWSEKDDRIEIRDNVLYPTFDPNNQKAVTITATVEVDGETASTDFKFRLGKESNYDEYMATTKGQQVSVSGYVSALGEYSTQYKNFSLNIVSKDKEHSYYAYRAKCSADVYNQLSVGQYIGITGEKDAYNGPQIKNGEISVLPGDSFTETAVKLTANDVTSGEKSPNLNRLVKVENLTLTSVFDEDENLFSGEFTEAGKTYYTAIKANKYYYEDGSAAKQAVVDKLKGLKPGDTINVEGYFAMYSGKVQLFVTDPNELTVVSSDANMEKLILAKDEVLTALNGAKFSDPDGGELTLSNTKGVEITATLSDTEQTSVKLEGTKLTFQATKTKVNVTLTVTLKQGDLTDTLEYKILCWIPGTKFDEFINANKGDVIDGISGVVTAAKVTPDSKKVDWAYVIIQDDNGAYYIRYKASKEEMNKYFEIGKKVSGVKGTLDIYGGLYQLTDLDLTGTSKGDVADLPTPKELTEEIIKDNAKVKQLLSSLVVLTGTVTADGKQIMVGETGFNFYVDKKLVAEGETAPKLEAGKKYKITGFVGCNKDKFQVNPLQVELVA